MKVLLICLSSLFACLHGNAQLANPDFESWFDDNGQTKLTGWEHLVKNDLNNVSLAGTWQTNNSQHNSYALILSRWYNYTWDVVRQKQSITGNPTALTGYYQYTENELTGGSNPLDTALVEVFLTRWNIPLQQQDTIGYGRKELGYSGGYSPFSCDISYLQVQQPDSILIRIEPSKWAGVSGYCADSNYCSFLTIDNLSLVDATSVPSIGSTSISIYPNPVTDILTIDNGRQQFDVSVRDITGRLVYEEKDCRGKKLLNASSWKAGVYLVEVRCLLGQGKTYKLMRG